MSPQFKKAIRVQAFGEELAAILNDMDLRPDEFRDALSIGTLTVGQPSADPISAPSQITNL